jgi:hypothetical protein
MKLSNFSQLGDHQLYFAGAVVRSTEFKKVPLPFTGGIRDLQPACNTMLVLTGEAMRIKS